LVIIYYVRVLYLLTIHSFVSASRIRFSNFVFFFYFQSRKKAKKGDNLDDLKQELDIDYHKISLEELYQRFSTNPDTVSIYLIFIVSHFSMALPFLGNGLD
jgi:hypothetical protein